MSIKQSVCVPIVRPAEMSMETFLAEVAAIAAIGCEGYVGHEFRPRGDALDALRQAFAQCNQ